MHTGNLELPNIDALLDENGAINIGHLPLVGQIAVASDPRETRAVLRRRSGESLADILLRLDAAIETTNSSGEPIDEINA